MVRLTSLILIITGIFTQVKSTSLKACQEDHYLSKNNVCIRCTICSRSQQMIHTCADLSDTICMCPLGMYHDMRKVACMQCSTCGVGEVMHERCLNSKDTKCQRCPNGFTSAGNNSLSCTSIHSSKSAQTIPMLWSFIFTIPLAIFLVWR
ncbi:tumor necrosis factor receptor superfamily member 16-like [Clytia hemisphaerica]|uniref:TNFR-Cys domain-containing protein n=1 Tax=Clytia hemisphaerica TaxID=252671 RepID=A0A7M5WRW9_9CNID|eukprot:TCONS_00046272-protein